MNILNDLTSFKLPSILNLIKYQKCGSCSEHIEDCQWNHGFPTQMHQLIISESWKSPTNPHENKDENQYFREHNGDLRDS